MKPIIGQITDELEKLGKKIIKETAKVPVDIAMPPKKQAEEKKNEDIPPRQQLEHFARPKQKEPSVYEKIQQEKIEKDRVKEAKAQKAAYQVLPKTGSRPKPGALFAAKKQAGSETSRNVKT